MLQFGYIKVFLVVFVNGLCLVCCEPFSIDTIDIPKGIQCENALPFPDPNRCGWYIKCRNVNGFWNIHQRKCKFDLMFDANRLKCGKKKCKTESSGRSFGSGSRSRSQCSSSQPYADPRHCGYYYTCTRVGFFASPRRKRCPGGLMFSDILGKCGPYKCSNVRPILG